jgi:hypothetical protein
MMGLQFGHVFGQLPQRIALYATQALGDKNIQEITDIQQTGRTDPSSIFYTGLT